MTSLRKIETDVLVVGTGPSGITAAALLATLGVSTVAISRHPGPAHTPRAHITNMRTLEVFRDMQIQEEVQAVGYPLAYMRHNVFGTTFAGMELARYTGYGTRADRQSDYAAASPCEPHNIQQHVMEPVILEAALKRGADVRFSTELVEITQTAEKATGRVRQRDSGEEYLIEASYVIGADGGRSTVAEQLGTEFEGETGLRDNVNMWVDVDLGKYTKYRPGVLFSMYPLEDVDAGGAWCCVRPWDDWYFISPGTAETPVEELLRRARLNIGDPDIEIKVKNVSPWQVNHLFATQYRKGRVFLAGDAAHRHPPGGGLGTNTSVQDSYNLAWKLSYVLSGKAGPGLLDTYHQERQPIGQFVVERAMKSTHNAPAVREALGLVPGKSEDEARASIDELLSDTPVGKTRRTGLQDAIRLQDYRSNANGVDLTQRYHSSGAIVDDGTPWPEPERDPELYYQATSHPGAPLPHAWIEHEQQLISTHDVVGRGNFTLLTGIGGEAWQAAADTVAAELGIEVPVRMIGQRCAYDDVYGEWAEVREVPDHGALLVRPDHHIAWRSPDLPDSPVTSLRSALQRILDR